MKVRRRRSPRGRKGGVKEEKCGDEEEEDMKMKRMRSQGERQKG